MENTGEWEAAWGWYLRIQPTTKRAGKFDYSRPWNPLDATRLGHSIHDGPPQRPAQMPPPLSPVAAGESDGLCRFRDKQGYTPVGESRCTCFGQAKVGAAAVGEGWHFFQPTTPPQLVHQGHAGNSGQMPVSGASAPQGSVPSHLAGGLGAGRGIGHWALVYNQARQFRRCQSWPG